jgi:predicted metalloprotease
LKSQFGATGGPLAQLYVIAHEWGHHIQNITGIMDNNLNLQETGPTSDSVRLELQADCFAGSWVGAAQTTKDENGVPFLQPVTHAEIADALNAAAAVGDDNIQQSTQGQVDPESFTHGTSAQREKWFTSGLNGGPQACDTFGASAATL